jgi:prepilin-type N-terminal cleavage/methylation domain-containing protein
MSDAGYTLVETLTALAILALAITGLTAGIQVLALQQLRVAAPAAATQELRAAQAAVDRLLASGPFRSQEPQRLSGDGGEFRVACGRPEPCRVGVQARGERVELDVTDAAGDRAVRLGPATTPVRIRYVAADGVFERWPPDGPERRTLRGVMIGPEDGAARPMIVSRAWREHPFGCQFDTVLRDCR